MSPGYTMLRPCFKVVFNRSCCHRSNDDVTFYLSIKIFQQYVFHLPSFSLWAATFPFPWFVMTYTHKLPKLCSATLSLAKPGFNLCCCGSGGSWGSHRKKVEEIMWPICKNRLNWLEFTWINLINRLIIEGGSNCRSIVGWTLYDSINLSLSWPADAFFIFSLSSPYWT